MLLKCSAGKMMQMNDEKNIPSQSKERWYNSFNFWQVEFKAKRITRYKEHLYNFVVHCSATQLCPSLCDPMDCSMPGFPVHHYLRKFVQTHVCWVGDAIQPSRPLSSPSPPAFYLSQHQGHLNAYIKSIYIII